MPLIIQGTGIITVTANNSTHTITITSSGGGGSGTGSYNETSANNVIINSNGFNINFINGTGNPVNVVNSNGGNQVNVTISSTGGSGETLDTIQCIGSYGQCLYFGNNTNTNFEFKNILGLQGIAITGNNSNVMIATNFKINNATCSSGYFMTSFDNSTGDHTCSPVSFSSNTVFKSNNVSCGAGNFVQSYSNTTGTYTCAADNGGTITTGSNIGTGGFGFFKTTSGSTMQFRNLTTSRSDLFTLTQSASDVNLGSSFKADSKTCTSQFLSAFDNATGLFTCATVTGFLTSINGLVGPALTITNDVLHNTKITSSGTTIKIDSNNTAQVINADNGESLVSSRFNATESKLMSLRNVTGYMLFNHNTTSITPSFQFKTNNISCSTGFYVSSFSNSTGIYTCTSVSTSSGSQYKSSTFTCSGGTAVTAFNNVTGTYTCTAFSGTTTTLNTFSGTLNLVRGNLGLTVTNSSNTISLSPLLVKLDDHTAGGVESSYTFTPGTALDFDTYSTIKVVVAGEATGAFALQMVLNGSATSTYNTGGETVTTAGARTGVGDAATAQATILSTTCIGAAGRDFEVTIEFNEQGTSYTGMTKHYPTWRSAGQCGDAGIYEDRGGSKNTVMRTLSSIKLQTSTSTWKQNTHIITYGVLR